MLKNYDGFLKVDGEVGNKKVYDPRAWGKIAETAMAARVVEATRQLGSAGKSDQREVGLDRLDRRQSGRLKLSFRNRSWLHCRSFTAVPSVR